MTDAPAHPGRRHVVKELPALAADALDASARAIPAGDIGRYLDARPKRRSGLTVAHDGRGAINRYHRLRHSSRAVEALSPGVDAGVQNLRFVQRIRSPRSLWNPKTREYETVRESWRHQLQQCAIVPLYVLTSTTFDVYERAALSVLYVHVRPNVLHRQGKFVVRGYSQSYLAQHANMSHAKFRQCLVTLTAKGAIQVRPKGYGKPATYFLAKRENGAWTYPAGSRRSARARAMRLHGTHRAETIQWNDFVHATKPVRAVPEAPPPRRRLDGERKGSPTSTAGDLVRLSVAALGAEAMKLMQAEAEAVRAARNATRLRPLPRVPVPSGDGAASPPPSAGVIHTLSSGPSRGSLRRVYSSSDRKENLASSRPLDVDNDGLDARGLGPRRE